ncbi:hypothetical protein BGZ76_009252 [Entomortierella beljakovae]|nr:hypothetical protein BGZ76_009252 [Entomortierella beljakovae]
MDLLHSKLVVNTTSIPFSTSPLGSSSSSPLSSPSLISSPTYFNNMNHDYFNGGVSAGDTTPALSPSSVKFSSGPNSSSEHLPLTQPANNEKRQISKPKFFICDDSDSDSDTYVDEKHEFTADTLHGNIMILSTDQILEESQHYGDCEDFDSSDDLSDTEDQDCLFGKKSPSFYSLSKCSETDSNSVPSPQCAFMGRRQSLLSDLLMAEKKQKSRTFQALSSTCHSSPNSDGESAAVHMASNPMSQIYPSNPQQHQRCEYNTSHGNTTHFNASIGRGRDRNDWTTNECQDSIKVSPLTRTKKVYKNLAEMGKLSFPTLPENSASLSISPCAAKVSTSPTATTSTTAATTTIMTASSINTSSSTSTSTSSNSTCKSSTSTRSRSRIQVQGQIQSLVAHSTSTAHRAFLSASATLTDVLFRTSQ